MSLVVAELHDGQISLVADTKVTVSGNDAATRHVFEHVFPKLLLLRDDLCVGLAGNDPEGVADNLIAARGETVESIVEIAESMNHASFVIASLNPELRLVQVHHGSAQNRSAIGQGWAGDVDAYSVFKHKYSEWPDGTEVPFLLMSSMQWLLTNNPVPSVGGYLTRVATTSKGFRYQSDETQVGPELLNMTSSLTDHVLELSLTTPANGDATMHRHLCAVGVSPTPGALAYLLDPSGIAVLFPHGAPHKPIPLRVASMKELKDLAATVHGQQLAD